MTATTNDHLTDIQIYQMLLDPSDSSETSKTHLSTCPRCRVALDAIRDELQMVGNMARTTTPNSTGTFHLPARQSRNPFTIFIGMRPWPRLAVSALALFLVVGTVLLLNPAQIHRTAYETSQMPDPDQLLSEIDELVETPFASEFLLTTTTNEVDADEDFMEFIVPAVENDPMTRKTGKKGESLC